VRLAILGRARISIVVPVGNRRGLYTHREHPTVRAVGRTERLGQNRTYRGTSLGTVSLRSGGMEWESTRTPS